MKNRSTVSRPKRSKALSRIHRRRNARAHRIERLENRYLLTAAPISDQFLVHETTGLDEYPPAIAVVESSGDFIAAWSSFEEPGGDESGLGVYVQRFDATGNALGTPVLVNQNQTEGDQFAPQVAVDASGNYLVIWQGQDDDGSGVYGQRFLADGSFQGDAFLVNDDPVGDQRFPTVAMDNAGNTLVAWESESSSGDVLVYAKHYAAGGEADPAFAVNTMTPGNQGAPAVAASRSGDHFVIAWEGEVIAEETDIDLFAQRYDGNASAVGGMIAISADTPRDQVSPGVAMDHAGNFVVTWTSEGIPGSGSDVFAQQFDATGMTLGSEFRVNETVLQGQLNSVVAADEDGDFMVTWQSSHQDDFSWGIFGRAYASNGTPLTKEFQVSTQSEQPQTSPALGSNSEGNVVALWLGNDAEHGSGIRGQRFQLPKSGVDFSAVGSELLLASALELEEAPAAAAVDAARNFLVVWQSYADDGSGLGIVGQRLDSTGAPRGESFIVNTTVLGNQIHPDVAMDDAGNAVVVWQSADEDGHGIFGQRFDSDGNPVGPEFHVNTEQLGHQTQPSVEMNRETGDFVVVWQGPDDSGEGIFGQRFLADGTLNGDWFQVNEETDLDQVSPSVTMNTAGEFAVAWVSDHRSLVDPENDSEKSIFVQWYSAEGVTDGPEQLVHSIVKEYQAQEYPDIALDASGNMVVVWQSITQDGSGWGVYGRQVTAAKTLIGESEFQINQTTSENQRQASVVAAPDGHFAVSWQSDLQDQSATAILSRQYAADGTAETDEMVVNTWEMGPQTLPVMAMTPAGDYGIFWNGMGLSRSEGIHGRIYEEGYIPPAPHLAVSPLGDQFLVGESSGIVQSSPAVAVFEQTGNYVAVWTSFEQSGGDESGLGVYAQLFRPDGTPLVPAFLVNGSHTIDDQTHPGVAVDDNGRLVIVWESLGQDGDAGGIYAQRYQFFDGSEATIGAIGSMIAVNTLTTGDQSSPAVAMDNAGNFVVTWQSDVGGVDGGEIFARRYDANVVALDTEEFQVNSTAEGNQTSPTVSRARQSSQFVIGWQSEVIGGEGEIDVEVMGKLFASDRTVLAEDFLINATSEHDQVGPHATMTSDGAFAFAWTVEGQVGSGADVYARRFDSTGQAREADFLVNETILRGQEAPTIGLDDAGNLLIAWQSSHQDGFSWGVYAKAYDDQLNVLAEEFQVNVNIQGPQTNPVLHANSQGTAIVTWLGLDEQHAPAVHAQRYVLPATEGSEFTAGPEGEIVLANYRALEEAPAAAAVDANGNSIVVWQSYGDDGSGLGVYGRRFNALGDPLGEVFQVNTTTLGNQGSPDVAVDDQGHFIIVWQSNDWSGDGYDIVARRFDPEGTPDGDEYRVNTSISGNQTNPTIAIDPDDGNGIIVWQAPEALEEEGLGIFGRRFNPTGIPTGDELHINTFTELDQVSPTIDMNRNGEFVIAWVSDHRAVIDPDDSEKSIFVQWFDQNGNSEGPEVLVHSIQSGFDAQELPDIAIDPEGNFVIVWQSINQDGNTWGVFARQFLADKTAVQPIEFQVNQTVLAPQRHASVGSDQDGNFVVAWQSHAQDASGPGVFARLYDAEAVAQTDEFLVPTWDQGPQTSPVIAMRDDGDFGVFWTGHGTDRAEGVHGRLYELIRETTADSIGLYQPDMSIFHLRETLTDGDPDLSFRFGPAGSAGWTPITGDWNADGIDTIGLYDPAFSLFHLKDTFTGGNADYFFAFGPGGNAGWIPLAGDWNGDGIDTIGLYQPDLSLFHLKDSFTGGASDLYFAFGPTGNVGWIPLAGDWNGDGIDTIGLYQPDLSVFHLKDSFTGGDADHYFAFGPSGDVGWTPVTGDWNGDGIDTIGLYQPDVSLFHLKDTFDGGVSDHYVLFGPAGNVGWIPITGDWNGPELASSQTEAIATTSQATLSDPLAKQTVSTVLDEQVSTIASTDSGEAEFADSETEGLVNRLAADLSDLSTREASETDSLQLLDQAFSDWS